MIGPGLEPKLEEPTKSKNRVNGEHFAKADLGDAHVSLLGQEKGERGIHLALYVMRL